MVSASAAGDSVAAAAAAGSPPAMAGTRYKGRQGSTVQQTVDERMECLNITVRLTSSVEAPASGSTAAVGTTGSAVAVSAAAAGASSFCKQVEQRFTQNGHSAAHPVL